MLAPWSALARLLGRGEERGQEQDPGQLYLGLVADRKVPDGGLGVYPRPWGGWLHVDLGRPRRWRG